ncbi:MAG: Gfo/Idh/MocA family protein [Halanaerobiaceae bacterium]
MAQEETLKYGMVGGGEGSFMGEVHRKAAAFHSDLELVSGCFSRNYEKTLKTGKNLGIAEERLYKDFEEMAENEAGKIDFVAIVLPNYAHYEAANPFVDRGINVLCEKPLTFTVAQAEDLQQRVQETEIVFAVNYSYSGFPMVKQARRMVEEGEIGEVTMVMGEYPQEWIATSLKDSDGDLSTWRIDPEIAGISNCVGDIGSHIENTVSYITGLEIESLCANLESVAGASELDDNASIMLKFDNGASGMYWSSQVAVGHDNGLKVRIYGTKGSIVWEQENPNYLEVSYSESPKQILSRARDDLYSEAEKVSTLPAGHPEGYYESFANMYQNYMEAVRAHLDGRYEPGKFDIPEIGAGVRGVKFIHNCVRSSKEGCVWVDFE